MGLPESIKVLFTLGKRARSNCLFVQLARNEEIPWSFVQAAAFLAELSFLKRTDWSLPAPKEAQAVRDLVDAVQKLQRQSVSAQIPGKLLRDARTEACDAKWISAGLSSILAGVYDWLDFGVRSRAGQRDLPAPGSSASGQPRTSLEDDEALLSNPNAQLSDSRRAALTLRADRRRFARDVAERVRRRLELASDAANQKTLLNACLKREDPATAADDRNEVNAYVSVAVPFVL